MFITKEQKKKNGSQGGSHFLDELVLQKRQMISRHFVCYIQSDEDDGDVICILKKKKIGVLITFSNSQPYIYHMFFSLVSIKKILVLG